MYLLIIFFPLMSAITAGLFGRFIGAKGVVIITTSSLLCSFFCSFFAFHEVALMECFVYIKLASWINCELLNVDWGFLYDTLTIVMCCIVTFISTLVHWYSIEYMLHDPHLSRFMSYLSFFTFFMLILVTSDNFVQMFVGWEGVGLSSYLLINFWFTRIQANKAAIKAMIINRVGDFGLVIGILLIYITFKAVDYATVFSLVPIVQNSYIIFLNIEIETLTIIGFFLFVGAVGKSAQLGLHTWLPDAMEGPTPVSALIHAATMVTAGVFLIARCSPIYEYTSTMLKIITIVGSSTAFFAATVGLLQNDLKKVIAYSTCSQLGYMIFACGISNYSVGVFHLANHAFFKALLFLGAGSIIHAVADEQDMRKMGGLKDLIPFTYSMIVIGSLALTGFPFLSGFYSKDLILEAAYGKFTESGHYSYYLGTFSAFFTAFYSTRLLFLTFLSKPNGFKYVICRVNEASFNISTTLGILAVPSLFVGYFTKDMFVGIGSSFWGNSIYNAPQNMNSVDAEFINPFFKLLPLFLSLLGLLTAFLFYKIKSKILFKLKVSSLGKKVYNFLNKKWFFDKIYNEQIGQFFFNFSYLTSYKIIDKGIFEIIGPNGLSFILLKFSSVISKMQTRYIYHYTYVFLIGFTLLLGFYYINFFYYPYYFKSMFFYIIVILIFFKIIRN
jgi:NADH-ubiquinone oxidoreductase chain 5